MLGYEVFGDVLTEIKHKAIVKPVDDFIIKFAKTLYKETNVEVLQRIISN